MSIAPVVAALLWVAPAFPFDEQIDAAVGDAATIFPVPKALVLAVISVESGFEPRAVSHAGAMGLMQLMPATARRVGIPERDLFDPARNVLGGVRLLAVLLRHYDGDITSALVAYNAGPRPLFAPLPRNAETPQHVFRVLHRLRWFERRLRFGGGGAISTTRVTSRRTGRRVPEVLATHQANAWRIGTMLAAPV